MPEVRNKVLRASK